MSYEVFRTAFEQRREGSSTLRPCCKKKKKGCLRWRALERGGGTKVAFAERGGKREGCNEVEMGFQ